MDDEIIKDLYREIARLKRRVEELEVNGPVPSAATPVTGTGANTRLAYWNGVTTLTSSSNLATSGSNIVINGLQVLGSRGAAITDASGGGTIDSQARTAINTWLARARTHGLIST